MLWGKKEEVEEIQFSLRKQSFSLQNILVSAASTYLAQEYPSLLESQLKKHISSFYICLDFKASVGYCVG